MTSIKDLIEPLDAYIGYILSGWNFYTTVFALLSLTVVAYGWLAWQDPDTHPFFLLHQSTVAPVRHAGASAVYRSLETPHGYPLKSGLDVKDHDAPKWSRGRDGDLRDVWMRATTGGQEGQPTGKKGKVFTVRGIEEIVEHGLDELSQEINIIGQDIQELGVKRVAIYLPNSVELLNSVFAAAFYGFTPILLPFNQSLETVTGWLAQTKADALIAGAGTVSLAEVANENTGLKHVIWVVQRASRHLDWNEVPEGIGGNVGVTVWHEMIEEKKAGAKVELPYRKDGYVPESIFTVWQKMKDDMGDIVEFTQGNLVAAISSLISSLPSQQRFSPSDLFLPADSLSLTYPLTMTLAALYTNASVALNSVAGPGSDLDLSARMVAPTIIVASAETIAEYHQKIKPQMTGRWSSYLYWLQSRALAAGRMPNGAFLNRPVVSSGPSTATTPGKLRLLFVSKRADTDSPPLSSTDLSDIRIFTGARVVYALTAARVAGAVASTNLYDYRRDEEKSNGGRARSHFGVPMSSLEIKLVDTPGHKTVEGSRPEGEITVKGPAVAGGEANLGVVGTFRDDHTLAYV